MSEKIILKDHKAYYEGWDSAAKKWVKGPVSADMILKYLWLPVEVGGNFQVKDLFKILVHFRAYPVPDMEETLLQIILGEHYVDALIAEYVGYTQGVRAKTKYLYNQIVVSYSGESGLFDNVHVNLKKNMADARGFHKCEFEYKIPKKIVTRKEMSIAFDVFGRVRGKKDCFAVEFAPFCAYADARLVLEDNFKLSEVDYTHAANKDVSKRAVTRDLGKATVTVLELIKALIYELTFCGSPADRDAKNEDLHKRVKECKEALKTGKAKLEK